MAFWECLAARTWEPPWAENSRSLLLLAAMSQAGETLSVLFSCCKETETPRKYSKEQTMEGDFQVCRNCKRNVASLHFTLHEAHCLRFLVLCPECEEPIPKSKMKEHVEVVHQQTKENQQHPAKCKFCELVVRFTNLDIHESLCGSQTKDCPHCNQPITLRELAQHKDVCLSAKSRPEEGKRTVSSPGRKTHCDTCKQTIPENEYVSHMKQCSRNMVYLRDGKTIVLPPSLLFMGTGKQTPTMRRDVRPKTKNRNSSTKRETKDQNGALDLPLKSGIQQRTALRKGEETAYDILRNCCQCQILLPLPILNEHQEKCLRLAHQKKLE
ncbi:XIAP-associated factor 1 isoform X2 [Arvicanthis niloticus]|uniref:XIAP-associated factor 1 isoform X2 n=1 Tax=Arvicanthis niloticus TaxID=61156 RepID=UPI001486FF84|nr:XIAP-associated factor 1 isoform X3 [Arvicanthis niloticus]